MDRLLFVYPENQNNLKWNLENIDDIHLENYNSIITNLLNLSYTTNSKLLPFTTKAKKLLFTWQNNRPNNHFFDYERSIDVKLQEYVIRFSLILQLLNDACTNSTSENIEIDSVKSAIKLFDYFYANAIKVRSTTIHRNYFDNLTELQKQIYTELPLEFKTSEGVTIATKLVNNKPRISERAFKNFLNDKNLFKRVSRGLYSKCI